MIVHGSTRLVGPRYARPMSARSSAPVSKSRRRLLRTGLLGGALLGLAGVIGRSVTGYELPAGVVAPRTLSNKELIVLAAIVSRIVAPDGADAPPADGFALASWLDGYLGGMDTALLADLRALLHFVEHGGPLFRGRATRFSRMSGVEQDATLDAFADSPLALRRQGLQALRALGFLAYYRDDRTFAMLGYPGPMVQRTAAPL
jgi:hypothetical protein